LVPDVPVQKQLHDNGLLVPWRFAHNAGLLRVKARSRWRMAHAGAEAAPQRRYDSRCHAARSRRRAHGLA